jgi:endonuclease/exonuclease/phosphatase family metal-dependent hydrolase
VGRGIDKDRSGLAPVLVGLSFVLLAQLVRAYVPLAFELGEELGGGTEGYLSAGVVALAVFASPLLAGVGSLTARGKTTLVASVVGLGVARLAIQFVHPIPLWLGALALTTGLFTLPVVVGAGRRIAGDAALLVGVYLGLALDTAIRTGAFTWDIAWQEGLAAIVATVSVALAVASAAAIPRTGWSRTTPPALRLAVFGPFLALQLLFLQNPAALASQAELPLPTAAGVILLFDAIALGIGSLRLRIGPPEAAGLVALAGIGGYLLNDASGPGAVLVFGVEQLLLVLLMGRALIPEPSRPVRPIRLAGACMLGSLVFVVVVFAFQVSVEVPLPFSNAFVPAAAAVIIGLSAMARTGTVAESAPARAALVPLVLLVVPALVGVSAPTLESTAQGEDVRILVYNVHGGVNVDGQVDPEATARAIEAERPDVVVLNEIGRGWPVFGGLDAAEWLSRRLEMPFLFEPAADLRFGNAILSRLPPIARSGRALPFGAGPQHRSYLVVEFDLGEDRQLAVIGTHLQESGSDPETRTRQIEFLLDAWDGVTPAIVAGDMNMQPDEEDVGMFLDAGLISVQDAIGDPCQPTAFEPKPEKPCDRPDWIFATPDLELSGFEITRTSASDHLPVAVTVTVPHRVSE